MNKLEELEKQLKERLEEAKEAVAQAEQANENPEDVERLQSELVARHAAFEIVSEDAEAFDRQRSKWKISSLDETFLKPII